MRNHKFSNGEFDRFETSEEVLAAIEDVAGWEFDLNDPDHCAACRVWADPTIEEEQDVIATAWANADPAETELWWNTRRLPRTAPAAVTPATENPV